MPKTKISEFSSTPGNNTDIDGINIAEGCAPSGINDAIRELMSQLKDFQAGTAGDSFGGPVPAASLTGQVAVSAGGTGSSTASGARTNLGLAIGTNVQAYDAQLDTLSGASADRATFLASDQGFGFRNRIINGDMRIDQRNAGASASTGAGTYAAYFLDRWQVAGAGGGVFSVQQSSVAPSGFSNSVLLTVTTADSSIAAGDYYQLRQTIEGFNFADLGFGAAGAQSVTLSFWVRSSLTGTFGLSLRNGAADRSYVATYTISSANTWEHKTVTIVGDTAGTWATNNTGAAIVTFSLGVGSTFEAVAGSWGAGSYVATSGSIDLVGTNGATFYITGVQLEAGSVATPFERRDYGRELIMCQRYYQSGNLIVRGNSATSGFVYYWVSWPVQMRTGPTVSISGTTYSNGSSGSANAPNKFGSEFVFSVSGASAFMQTDFASTAEL